MATAVTPLTPKRKRTVIGTTNDPRDIHYTQLPANAGGASLYSQIPYYVSPSGEIVPLPGQGGRGGSVGGAASPVGSTPAPTASAPAPASPPASSTGSSAVTRAGSPSSIQAEEITGQKRRARRKASAPRGTPGLARRPTTVTTLSQPASPLGGG